MQSERAGKEAGTSSVPSYCSAASTGYDKANDPEKQQGGCSMAGISFLYQDMTFHPKTVK